MTALRQSVLADSPDTATLIGRVTSVTFHNAQNGYSVLRLSVENNADLTADTVTAVGVMPTPREGEEYELKGRYITHPKFGRQFEFESYDLRLPTGREGIVRYLSSLVDGVGPVKSARIVGALGDECLTRIPADPSCLVPLAWLTSEQRQQLVAKLSEKPILAELCSLICREGITPYLASKIYAHYKEEAVNVIKENPYILADELWGVGFKTADAIALQTGLDPRSPHRMRAAVRYVLKEAENDGHCYLTPNQLMGKTPEDRGKDRLPQVLGEPADVGLVRRAVADLIHAEILVREDNALYFKTMRDAEERVAAKIRVLSARKLHQDPAANIDGLIARAETDQGFPYHEKQREAVKVALTSGFSVISGGPGTGKTTISRTVVEDYISLDHTKPVYLCAPTGRAAKRLSEMTGHDAATIHRMLGYRPMGEKWAFAFNGANTLEPGLLLCDESSMIALDLADSLLSACPDDMQVVLVGDVDQLPSVGPGSVLRDIILSGAVPVVMLEYVYRQEEGSGISLAAHQVNAGEIPTLKDLGDDVVSVEVQTPEEAAEAAVRHAKEAYDRYGLLGFGVLSPMKKGVSGVNALNERIRDALNPAHSTQGIGLGDKVLVTKNDYGHDVFNGDLGIVVDVGHGPEGDEILKVDFGDDFLEFCYDDEAGDYANPAILQLAFASTVHKTQGNEFPVSIVVLTRSHIHMAQKNLLYTAMTRAKKRLVVIHEQGVVRHAVRNDRIAQRNSRLAERLAERFKGGVTS